MASEWLFVDLMLCVCLSGYLPITTFLAQKHLVPKAKRRTVVAIGIANFLVCAIFLSMNYRTLSGFVSKAWDQGVDGVQYAENYLEQLPTKKAELEYEAMDQALRGMLANYQAHDEKDRQQFIAALGPISLNDERLLSTPQQGEITVAREIVGAWQRRDPAVWKGILAAHSNDLLTPLAQGELALLTPPAPPSPPASVAAALAAGAAYEAGIQSGRPFDRNSLVLAIRAVTPADEAISTDDQRAKIDSERKMVVEWEQKPAPIVQNVTEPLCDDRGQLQQALANGPAAFHTFVNQCRAGTPDVRQLEASRLIAYAENENRANDTGTLKPTDVAEVIEAVRTAVAIFSKDRRPSSKEADAHFWLGRFLSLAGQKSEAIAEMKRAIALRPRDARILNMLGKIYWSVGDAAKAFEEYDAALSTPKGYPIAFFNKGAIFDAQGNYEEALKMLAAEEWANTYQWDKKDTVKYLIGECFTYRHMKKYDYSVYKCKTAIDAYKRIDPTDPSPFIELGKTYLDMADYMSAMGQFEKALRVSPSNIEANDLLVQARSHLAVTASR